MFNVLHDDNFGIFLVLWDMDRTQCAVGRNLVDKSRRGRYWYMFNGLYVYYM